MMGPALNALPTGWPVDARALLLSAIKYLLLQRVKCSVSITCSHLQMCQLSPARQEAHSIRTVCEHTASQTSKLGFERPKSQAGLGGRRAPAARPRMSPAATRRPRATAAPAVAPRSAHSAARPRACTPCPAPPHQLCLTSVLRLELMRSLKSRNLHAAAGGTDCAA